MNIGKSLRDKIKLQGFEESDIKSVSSKYDQNKGVILTTIKTKCGNIIDFEESTTWYASRKNKSW